MTWFHWLFIAFGVAVILTVLAALYCFKAWIEGECRKGESVAEMQEEGDDLEYLDPYIKSGRD